MEPVNRAYSTLIDQSPKSLSPKVLKPQTSNNILFTYYNLELEERWN